MDWIKDNIPYKPQDNIKGIVYKMSYKDKTYYGKKVIVTPKGKESDYKNYYGSSKSWKEFIEGNHHNVKREVIYECRNKSEMFYYEAKIIIDNNCLFDPDCFNKNLAMVTTSNHVKNFINKPF